MKPGRESRNKFLSYLTATLRILGKVNELYVKSVLGCVGRFDKSSVGCYDPIPYYQYQMSPIKDFTDEDLRELARALSSKRIRGTGLVKRGYSTRGAELERIDEDKPCEFGDES